MRLKNLFNQLGRATRVAALVFGAWMCLLAMPAAAQKVVVLTAADVGKVVTGTYHYAEKDQSFKLMLKHRLGDQKNWQVSLQKSQQFDKSPFTLKSELPATVGPDGVLEIEFGVTYSKSLQQENTISLLAVPVGETDAIRNGIAINIKLSADGVLMFFSERNNQYSKSLPTFEFVGPGEKMVEVTWNGGGAKACTIKIEDSGRNGFTLVPNAAGAAPLASGSKVSLTNGGTSFFIKYDGAARKGNADLARITFTESSGQSIVTTMVGTYQGGTSLLAAAKDLLLKGNLMGGYNPNDAAVIAAKPIKDPAATTTVPTKVDNAGSGKIDPKNGAGSGNPNPVVINNPPSETVRNTVPVPASKPQPSAKPEAVAFEDFSGDLLSGDQAKERLRKYYRRFGDGNLVKIPTAKFEKNEGLYQARLRIVKADSLQRDESFGLVFIRAKLKNATDSITINAGDNAKMLGDTTLMLSLTSEDRAKLASADSFQVSAEFTPDYESADGNVTLDSLVFKGVTFGKVYSNNNWLILLWISLIAAVVLFFVIGYIISRQPVSSFRYLRESRYQRERHNANSQRQRVDVETVHIDLGRRETDLIQLAFVDRGEGLDGRSEGGIEKVRSIAATVPSPRRSGLRRFFGWLYAPFGRAREPKFRSVYYSLRIELPRGSVPQHLRLKDESGMLMLGTSLSGNVLATDHQDFKFVKRPFNYSLYLDPSEFVDYTGAMKTVSIPFRVIEEPFEGYVMTREFNLNLEIAQRY
jgi:hypothetical protein